MNFTADRKPTLTSGKVRRVYSTLLSRTQPDLILHNCLKEQLGISKITRSSKNISIHLGVERTLEHNDYDTVRCVPATGNSGPADQFQFTVPLNGSPERAFHWTKTRKTELGASKWTGRYFKLVDEGSKEIVAVYFNRMGIHYHLSNA